MPVSDEDRSNARRRYREAHAEEIRAYNRRWVAENRERHNAHSRKSAARKRAREHKRERQRQRWANRTPEQRERDRRRLRTFHELHPEKSREYKNRWRAKDPENAREVSRRSAAAWRDRHAERDRAKNREAAAQRRADDPDINRRYYQANLERERERGREASRQRARLKKAGLPPRAIHKTYAAEKRANQREADEFFAKIRDSRVLFELEPGHGAEARIDTTRRAHQGLIDRRQEDAILARVPQALAALHAKHGTRIREEIRLDNVARVHQGKEPHDLDLESNRRMLHQVLARLAPNADQESLLQRFQAIEAAGERLEEALRGPRPNSTTQPRDLDRLQESVRANRDAADRLLADSNAARSATTRSRGSNRPGATSSPEPAPSNEPTHRRGPRL